MRRRVEEDRDVSGMSGKRRRYRFRVDSSAESVGQKSAPGSRR